MPGLTWVNIISPPAAAGFVSLSDLNGEAEYTTTVSFSAMRFTFTRLTRPQTYLPLVHYTDPSGRPPADVGVIQAQGFDACHLPTIIRNADLVERQARIPFMRCISVGFIYRHFVRVQMQPG